MRFNLFIIKAIVMLALMLPVWFASAQDEFVDAAIATTATRTTIYKIEWHPGGQVLAVATADGVQLYTTDMQLITQVHPGDLIYGLSWNPDGSELAVTNSSTLEIWNWDSGTQALTLVRTIQGDNLQIGVFWSPDGSRIAAIETEVIMDEWSGTFRIWSTTTWHSERLIAGRYAFEKERPNANRLAWSPDRAPLLAEVGDQVRTDNGIPYIDGLPMIFIFNVETGATVQEIPVIGHGPETAVAWQPSGDFMATGGPLVTELYNLSTGEYSPIGYPGETRAVAWSPDGWYIAGDDSISDITTGQLVGSFVRDTGIVAIDWHPNGEWLTVADYHGVIKIEDATILPGFEPPPPTPSPAPAPSPTESGEAGG